MKCAGCDIELLRREHAQPLTIQGLRYWPASICDPCARANAWLGGSLEALDRLGTEAIDPVERERVRIATADWTTMTEPLRALLPAEEAL